MIDDFCLMIDYFFNVFFETPSIFSLDKLEYVIYPQEKIFDELGKDVINEDNSPPVQDSANDNLIFFFKHFFISRLVFF